MSSASVRSRAVVVYLDAVRVPPHPLPSRPIKLALLHNPLSLRRLIPSDFIILLWVSAWQRGFLVFGARNFIVAAVAGSPLVIHGGNPLDST